MQYLPVMYMLEAKAELDKPIKDDSLWQMDLLTLQSCAQVSCKLSSRESYGLLASDL